MNALLVGGPRDGTPFVAADVATIDLEIDGLVHRYIRTSRDRAGGMRVYAYDGVVDHRTSSRVRTRYERR